MLDGFEAEEPAFDVEVERTEIDDGFWDLSGSIETTGSVNFLDHESDTGTDYTGLQRLRNRMNLQLDLELGEHWQARAEGWAFADAAYLLNGRSDYTGRVLREYELDADVGELWIQGEPLDWLDVTAGRQIVIWGRSETLRVLDVLNPLDNREPGRIDLEDLRLPVGMLKLDAWFGDWSLSGIAIPEIRFDDNPVNGSDFFPSPPPGVALPREDEPDDFVDSEFAGSLTGIFSGWDISLHGAWFWDDLPRLDRAFPNPRTVHDRLWMVGAGGNFTWGGWLFKSELAWLDGYEFLVSEDGFTFSRTDEKSRLDGLAGLEYYGFVDTTLSLEIAVRHLFDYESALKRSPNFLRETSEQIAVRVTRNFLREKLTLTLLAVIFEIDARDGAIMRADVEYDVLDAVSVGLGVILYEAGELPPISEWQRNDRVIFSAKWSF